MFRWQEFSQQEQHELATMCFSLFKGSGNASTAWVVRSKSSLLMSLITKRMGQPFWGQLLRELLPYATQGPPEAEKVSSSSLCHPPDLALVCLAKSLVILLLKDLSDQRHWHACLLE